MKKARQYICDTNVLISGVICSGSIPHHVLYYIIDNGFFVFSDETYSELENVFHREKFNRFISLENRLDVLEDITSASKYCDIQEKVELCRDPKDNKFLDVALANNSEFLITGDEDLLVLKKIGETKIITPRKFVEIFS